jgi:hypothetical protein
MADSAGLDSQQQQKACIREATDALFCRVGCVCLLRAGSSGGVLV